MLSSFDTNFPWGSLFLLIFYDKTLSKLVQEHLSATFHYLPIQGTSWSFQQVTSQALDTQSTFSKHELVLATSDNHTQENKSVE